jgi:hypothetical protein
MGQTWPCLKTWPILQVQQRPQVIDDFFRNFLLKCVDAMILSSGCQQHNLLGRYGMKRSLDVFQAEWYEMQQSGKFKVRALACRKLWKIQHKNLVNLMFGFGLGASIHFTHLCTGL